MRPFRSIPIKSWNARATRQKRVKSRFIGQLRNSRPNVLEFHGDRPPRPNIFSRIDFTETSGTNPSSKAVMAANTALHYSMLIRPDKYRKRYKRKTGQGQARSGNINKDAKQHQLGNFGSGGNSKCITFVCILSKRPCNVSPSSHTYVKAE